MLALGLCYLLLPRVPDEVVSQLFIGSEAGSNFVVMHAFFALVAEFLGDIEVRVLGWLDQVGVDFEGKRSEIAIVDATTSLDVLLDVLTQGLED